MSVKSPRPLNVSVGPETRIAIVASRFNEPIVGELLAGCVRRLDALGVDAARVDIQWVPGAFELPLAAQTMARTGRFAAVICLGAVIRGDTPHFDFVAGNCAAGIARVALDERLPVIFGVLTTNDEQQARDRIGGPHGHAGERAADAAVEMIHFMRITHS